MYQIIFIYIMLTNDPYEYVLFLDVIVHIYAEKPNKFKFKKSSREIVPIGKASDIRIILSLLSNIMM